jgi:hypothetical protein
MKMFRKTEDGAIDNLLRAHAARAGGPHPICQEFDPDLANAFIEHRLTASELGRYQQHLSLCASCRKSVVALARMATPDTVFPGAGAETRAGIRESERRLGASLGAIFRPQWAMAAAAIIILAISVPLFLSRKDQGANQQSRDAQIAQTQASKDAEPGDKERQEGAVAGAAAADPAQLMQQAPGAQDKNASKSASSSIEEDERIKEPSAGQASGAAGGVVAKNSPPQTQAVEDKSASPNTDQIAAKDINAGQVPIPDVAAPAPQRPASEGELAKIDPDAAKSVSDDSKEKADASVLRRARPDGNQRAKSEAVVGADEIAPPPASSNVKGRTMKSPPPGGLGIRDNRLTDSARNAGGAISRKVGSKKFWLKDDTWVDKDYNPEKEMPFVTIIRDSDVYKELLAKRQGMKYYLTDFDKSARVIFIYKGTVYKLIPQEGNK